MDNQLEFSNLIQSVLGPENMILSGRKDMFHFAMKINELEGLLELEDIFALLWVNDNIEDKDCAEFLLDLENDYVEAQGSYDETGSIEGIERHFVDGMQYVYCYLKDLPVGENTRADAVKWFLSNRTKYKLGRVIVAYAIGYMIEAMFEE